MSISSLESLAGFGGVRELYDGSNTVEIGWWSGLCYLPCFRSICVLFFCIFVVIDSFWILIPHRSRPARSWIYTYCTVCMYVDFFGMRACARRRYSGVTVALHDVTRRYMSLHGVTWRYMTLHNFKWRYTTLNDVTLQSSLQFASKNGVTRRYTALHVVTRRYTTFTWCYRDVTVTLPWRYKFDRGSKKKLRTYIP